MDFFPQWDKDFSSLNGPTNIVQEIIPLPPLKNDTHVPSDNMPIFIRQAFFCLNFFPDFAVVLLFKT
jgi:hypothetical protein